MDITVNSGGVGHMDLSGGASNLTINGFADYIVTSEFDDVLEVSGEGGMISLGDGNNSATVDGYVATLPEYGIVVQGGEGIDTLDFFNFTAGITFSLDESGRWQNVGAADPLDEKLADVFGYVSETSVENLVGSQYDDKLTGDKGDNVIEGQKGRDSLFGGSGADTLDGGKGKDRLYGGGGDDLIYGGIGFDLLEGGKGDDTLNGGENNDVLRGAQGADVFEFELNSGVDRIKDFEDGSDLIRLISTGGFAGLSIYDQGSDLRIDHDGGSIILDDLAGLVLTSADFEFIV